MESLLAKLAADPDRQKLIFMPVSRLLVEDICRVGDICIFPPGKIDLEKYHPVPNKVLGAAEHAITCLAGPDLREVATSITGFEPRVLAEMPLIVFIKELDWESFLSQDHDADVELLKSLSSVAERAFDFIRFHYCRFDLPETLPGAVGSWLGSNGFLGAMIYTLADNESYLIAGEAIECSIVARGVGLDLSVEVIDSLPDAHIGEVAAVAVHALSLFSDVMTSNNDTVKFGRAMTLIEFLANPDEFRNWKRLKGDIVCHCARDKSDYHRLCNRFEELTSIVDQSGRQAGLRTLVIHHGRFLNDILTNPVDRKSLFRELQIYASCVLGDMLKNPSMTWSEFQALRDQKKRILGVA